MKSQIAATSAILVAIALALAGQAEGQIYDTNNNYVQIFAGSGVASYLEGQGTQAMFNQPSAVVADTSSNLFVLDSGNRRIRRITPSGSTSTFVRSEEHTSELQSRFGIS